MGSIMMRIELKINGSTMPAEVDDDTPLLWVLRDTLKLKGTKYGCGIGQCGACTVIVDGQTARSCSLAATASGKSPLATCLQIRFKVFCKCLMKFDPKSLGI